VIAMTDVAAPKAWDFSFETLTGKPLPLSVFKGKAVLVVNTASQCGFTPQYEGLEELSKKYRDKGLVVLGVPCNDFGGQEPGGAEEIGQFCQINYGVSFPMAGKSKVTGRDAHPFYAWARAQVGILGSPKWNFHKYLVAPDGTLADWFSTPTKPSAGRVQKAIEKVLPQKT
jgi:glutathione peroxidase